MNRLRALALLAVLGACTRAGEVTDSPDPTCSVTELVAPDGSCCAPGSLPGELGCVPAGVPADACAEQFVHDGDAGCVPIEPASACAPGTMAPPGESTCRPVAPCGDAPYGAAPSEAGTQHVDAAYAGGASDGSAGAPWTTVQAAVDAASPGAVVAVAAGIYPEAVRIVGKTVRLWGRCPEQVTVEAPAGGQAAVFLDGADGAEIRDLSLRGAAMGILLSNAEGVIVDRVRIHDTAERGLDAEATLGPASVTVTRSLVERVAVHGLFFSGADATVQDCVVRDVATDASGFFGRGITIRHQETTATRSTVRVARTLVSATREYGILVQSAGAEIDATVVRGTAANADGLGRGIFVADVPGGQRAEVALTRSLVEGNHEHGVLAVASDVRIDSTVVRGTLPDAMGYFGRGVGAQVQPASGAHTVLTLRRSLIEGNHDVGVFGSGAQVVVESTVVRDTAPDGDGLFGRGLAAQSDLATGARSALHVRGCRVERSHDVGVFVSDGETTISSTYIGDTRVDGNGDFGDGFTVVGYAPGLALAQIDRSLVTGSARAGLSSFGAAVGVQGVRFDCNGIDLNAEEQFFDLTVPSEVDDLGDNACGCGETPAACVVRSSGLAPPTPLAEG